MARHPSAIVAGCIVLSLARVVSAQDGPAAVLPPPAPADMVRAASLPPAIPEDEALRLDEYLNRLDEWRAQGRISAAESARARQILQAAIIGRNRAAHVPLDANGRIDLLALARGKSPAATTAGPAGDRLATRVIDEFDLRMRLKARDIATPGALAMFDAAPGYVSVSSRELGRIVKDTLESTPLREVPGGTQLLGAIDALPNVTGAKSDHTMRELSRLVGDRQEHWVRQSGAGRFINDHRLMMGLGAFGAITALRRSNPDAARFIDRLGLRLRLSRKSRHDGRMYTISRLVYRNGYTLPELEFESGTRQSAGAITVHTSVAGTVSAEALHRARARVAAGARWEHGPLFADTTALFAFVDQLARAELRGGYFTDSGLAVSAALAATFGRYSGAIGPAPGRLSYELDVTKNLFVGHSTGELGLFVATSADSDWSHPDGRLGLVFRLRFGATQR